MYIQTLFPLLRFTFLEISIVYCIYKKNAIYLKLYFITHIKCYYKLHSH